MCPCDHRRTPVPDELTAAGAFIAAAIVRHAALRRRDGMPVPELAVIVAKWCADQARGGEVGQPLATGEGGRDVGVMDQLLLTDRAAAALLGVSPRTVRSLISAGELLAVKIRGATRIRRSDLDVFIAGQPARPSFRDDVQVKAGDAVGGAT